MRYGESGACAGVVNNSASYCQGLISEEFLIGNSAGHAASTI